MVDTQALDSDGSMIHVGYYTLIASNHAQVCYRRRNQTLHQESTSRTRNAPLQNNNQVLPTLVSSNRYSEYFRKF
jgi:hypothetical protein